MASIIHALILPALVASSPATDTEARGWIRLDSDELSPVLGGRFQRDFREFEILTGRAQESSTPYINIDQTQVFVASRRGVLEALDLDSGKTLWRRTRLGSFGFSMEEYEGRLFLSIGSDIVALDIYTGEERGRIKVDGRVGGESVRSGRILFFPVRPNAFVAIDAKAQKLLWKIKKPTPEKMTVRGQARPAVDKRRGLAYLGFSDGSIVAVKIKTGETVWERALGKDTNLFGDVDASPILVDGGRSLVVASYNGGLYKLEPKTGRTLYKRDIRSIRGIAQPEEKKGIMVVTTDRQALGVYTKTGKVRWRYRTKKGAPTEPVPLGKSKVAFGVSEGPLTVLDIRNGRPVQLYTPGNGISLTPHYREPDLAMMTNQGRLLVLRYGAGINVSK